MSSRLGAHAVRVATAALIFTTISSTAVAQTTDDTTTTPTMIILDASGSMLEDDAPGLRIDAAKSAIHDMVSGLPSSCFAVYREAMWKVSGTQFLTGAWGRAPT